MVFNPLNVYCVKFSLVIVFTIILFVSIISPTIPSKHSFVVFFGAFLYKFPISTSKSVKCILPSLSKSAWISTKIIGFNMKKNLKNIVTFFQIFIKFCTIPYLDNFFDVLLFRCYKFLINIRISCALVKKVITNNFFFNFWTGKPRTDWLSNI